MLYVDLAIGLFPKRLASIIVVKDGRACVQYDCNSQVHGVEATEKAGAENPAQSKTQG